MSIRGDNWIVFASQVLEHIDMYTVPQYGDAPDDQVAAWTTEDCLKAVRKYLARHGTGQRGPDDELRDLIKIAHYASLAYEKMASKLNLAE
jgi:hypothetical protein